MVILTHMAKPYSPDPRIVLMCHIKLFIVIAVKLANVTVVIIPLKAPHHISQGNYKVTFMVIMTHMAKPPALVLNQCCRVT